MRRFSLTIALIGLLGFLAACENRPPVDVYGHKDSLYQRLVIGLPF
jgi:hypothetical protein